MSATKVWSHSYLLRWFDGEGEVLEHKRKVVRVAECNVLHCQCPLVWPVGRRGLVRRERLQRGLGVQVTVAHDALG